MCTEKIHRACCDRVEVEPHKMVELQPKRASTFQNMRRRTTLLCNAIIEHVPNHQRSPFVLSGYRKNAKSHWYCFKSMFRLHNETVNIWTHFIGAVWFLYRLTSFIRYEPNILTVDGIAVVFSIAGALGCMTCSTLFHTFSAITHEHTYHKCHRCDLIGILGVIFAFYIGGVAVVFANHPGLRLFYLAYSVIACSCGSLPIIFAAIRLNRVLSFCALSICSFSGFIPVVHFLIVANAVETAAVAVPFGIGSIAVALGGFFFFTGYPECKYPGRYDLFFSSHQIWHVLVFFGLAALLESFIAVYRTRFLALQ